MSRFTPGRDIDDISFRVGFESEYVYSDGYTDGYAAGLAAGITQGRNQLAFLATRGVTIYTLIGTASSTSLVFNPTETIYGFINATTSNKSIINNTGYVLSVTTGNYTSINNLITIINAPRPPSSYLYSGQSFTLPSGSTSGTTTTYPAVIFQYV